MSGWSDESRWVSEDGVRCYFSERARRGPTRLECYRRMLREPMPPTPARAPFELAAALAGLRRVAGWVDIMRARLAKPVGIDIA
jgi:hypothetical protein